MAIAAGTVARDMYTLYKEMIADLFGDDGCDMTLSENHGYPVQAHHCISCSVMAKVAGGKLAKLATKCGYDINGRNNGLALPAYFGHQMKEHKQRHRGGHSDEYYGKVRDTISPIYDAYKDADPCNDPKALKDILGELKAAESKIKSKLEKPSWWLYPFGGQLYDGDYRDEGTGNMNSGRAREGSYSAGLEWLGNFSGKPRRRHEIKSGKVIVRKKWYSNNGYPVPGGPNA